CIDYLVDEIGVLIDFFFQAEDGIRDFHVTGVQTCALPIYAEYYQPKYEDYLELIYNYSQGAEYLENIVRLKDKNFIPKENINYKDRKERRVGKEGRYMCGQ